jgi:hypothetical protein
VTAGRAAPLAGLALVATACGSSSTAPAPRLPVARGNVVRIAVTKLPKAPVQHPRGLKLVFVHVDPHRALQLFRRGKLDEAPVPIGDIQAVLRDPSLRRAVRIRRLNAVDLVACRPGGALDRLAELRRTYDDTADRAEYQALVPELEAPPAEKLGERTKPNARAAAVAYSRAREEIGRLPRVAVRFAKPADPVLAYGLDLLVASWRDIGLGAYIGRGRPDARFERVYAPSPRPGSCVIPIAWAVDARLLSPRLLGWNENARGRVDYSRLRVRAPSRSR